MFVLQSRVQNFGTKVITIIENMILTGEGEQLVREREREERKGKNASFILLHVLVDVGRGETCWISEERNCHCWLHDFRCCGIIQEYTCW